MRMAEWICNLNDSELLSELHWKLQTFGIPRHLADRAKLIERFHGLRIEVFSNEHPPPHFRVKCAEDSGNYRISDCEQLNGGLRKYHAVIREWHSKHKSKLIAAWNSSRPSDCPVGEYIDA
jgi:hypothetical protein